MATLCITEYAELPDQRGQMILIGKEPSIAVQKVAIGVASTQAVAFKAGTKFVRLNTDAACAFKMGADPTAVAATCSRMSAGATEFFGITKGHKLAVITSA